MNSQPKIVTAPNITAQHQAFIEIQNHCALCTEQLEIRAESYLEDYTLREEAFCPKCNIKTRIKDHKMQ